MRWTLPNILTLFRLAAAPTLALAYVALPHPWADWTALSLFVAAAATDWLDGRIARAWNQVSRFGAMLDPIADKAMVVIALAVLLAQFGVQWILVVPVTVILFREVFVSGLREFLGDVAGTLRVTPLAKWKTVVQMAAVIALFGALIAENTALALTMGMDALLVDQVLTGQIEDRVGLRPWVAALPVLTNGGLVCLWLAALLTAITGLDYYRRALPHLREG